MLLELIGYSYHIFFGTAPADGFETSSQQNEPKPHKNFKTVMLWCIVLLLLSSQQ